MRQQYVIDVPPNYLDIVKAFHLRVDTPVLFSYGRTVYNPMDIDVPPQLIAHELVHRNERRAAFKIVAGRMAAPLYGSMVGKKRAMELIR